MQSKYTRLILFSILFTMLGLIALMAIIFGILYFAMPKDLADFTYSVGNERFASHLYFKAYKQNNDIDLCYKALNLKIKVDDDSGIVEIYQAYLNDDEYSSYNELMRIHNDNIECTPLERSVILNDKNYLENKYIASLIDLNRSTDAFERAVANMSGYESYSFKEQGLYNLNYFVKNINDYYVVYEGYSKMLVDAMQDYFDKSIETFNEHKDTDDELDKAYLISLGNRLMLVGQNINSIYQSKNEKLDIQNTNTANLQMINDTIKGLV